MGVSSNRVEDFSSDIENRHSPSAIAQPLETHKVYLPPKKTTFQSLKQRFSEIFFPDDPLSQFKNQPFLRKLVLGLQYFFPIFQWGPDYSLKLLKSDLISGLTIASLAIPQGISYAKLANLPPIIGLYSSFVPPLIYAILGSSRDLAVGPVSIASLVMGSMIREMVSPVKEPILYLQLAFTATFFAGVFQASLGLLRLGFIVDFLSKATLIGFMAGAAIIVSLQQLKGLLGIVHFTNKMGFVPVMLSVFKHRTEWAWQTIVMGFCFLLFLLIARHISMRKPKLFWVSAAAPLTSVFLSTLAVYIFKAQNHGIRTIGHLEEGLNPPSANMLYFHGPFLGLAIKTGIVTGILSLTEGIAVGRTFASLKNYQVDGNKEMMAIGLMNMAGSCTSCYVTTGSFSRSAVNYNAGSKTAVSNIILAATVLVTLLFLMPLFYYTPNVILAAIIITAVIGLIDFQAAFRLWKVDKLDFLACSSAFFGVLFISVQMGLAIAVGISIFKILIHVTRPNISMLGKVPGTQIYRNASHYRDASRVSSLAIFPDLQCSDLNFASSFSGLTLPLLPHLVFCRICVFASAVLCFCILCYCLICIHNFLSASVSTSAPPASPPFGSGPEPFIVFVCICISAVYLCEILDLQPLGLFPLPLVISSHHYSSRPIPTPRSDPDLTRSINRGSRLANLLVVPDPDFFSS